jgi:GMP synthase (glutamine-hydrolysing)
MTEAMFTAEETVPILDFGSQYVQLIARRVREAGVRAILVDPATPVVELKKLHPVGLILSGGPSSVYQADAPRCDPEIFNLGVPILGICYGMQIAAELLGGKVKKGNAGEYGSARLTITDTPEAADLFSGVPSNTSVWMSHGDQVNALGPEFMPLAGTPDCPLAAMRHGSRPFFGVQFHPEVTHTPHGGKVLENFLYRVCKASGTWRMGNFMELSIDAICRQVGTGRVICGLSGGVDSAVAAALIHRAIGDQLTCIFVDNGLLRKNERQNVESTFRDHFHIDLRVIDAEEDFLTALKGVTEPQTKRKIIGKAFIDVFKREAARIRDARFLAQGTLYPDVIGRGQGY